MDELSATQELLVESVVVVKVFTETPVVRKNTTSCALPLHADLAHTPTDATGPGKTPVASAAGIVECPVCGSKMVMRNLRQRVGGHILHNKVQRVFALRSRLHPCVL